MPTYEYRCQNCKKRFNLVLAYTEYGKQPVTCPHCQSANVQRRIGRIRVARSDDSRMESLADPASLAGLEDDPRTLGRMMRDMSREVGEEMPPEFDEVVGRLEKGQSPDDIERELPELGQGDGLGDGLGTVPGDDLGGDDF
jgi:putative FmdB family regulatory protein